MVEADLDCGLMVGAGKDVEVRVARCCVCGDKAVEEVGVGRGAGLGL